MPPSRPPEPDDTLVETLHQLRDLMERQNAFLAGMASSNPRIQQQMAQGMKTGNSYPPPPPEPNPASGPVYPGQPWHYTQVGPTPGVTYYGGPAGSNRPVTWEQPMIQVPIPGHPVIMTPEQAAKQASRPPGASERGYRFSGSGGDLETGHAPFEGVPASPFRARPTEREAEQIGSFERYGNYTSRPPGAPDPDTTQAPFGRPQPPRPEAETEEFPDTQPRGGPRHRPAVAEARIEDPYEGAKSTPQKAYDRTLGALMRSGQGVHERMMNNNPLYGSLATAGAAAALGNTSNPVLQSAAGNILTAGGGAAGGSAIGNLVRGALFTKVGAAIGAAGLFGGSFGGANSVQGAGANLGFERGQEWNIPLTNIGFQTPFARNDPLVNLPHFPDIPRPSPAVMEEIRRRFTTFRLGSEAGISMGQAAEITGGLRGMGYAQDTAQNAAFNSIAPLVRRGLSPNVANSMFDQSVRMGNASLQDFNKSMANLNEVALATRQTMDEAAEGLSQFAEAAQGMGAYRNQGVAAGAALAGATGMPGGLLARWTQNPMVQTMGFQRQGIMPLAFGAARPGMQAQAISDAFDAMKNATGAYARETRGPGGERITAQQNQYAAMSQMLGVPVDEIARMDRIRTRLPELTRANEALANFGEAGARAHRASRRVTAGDLTFDDRGVPIRTREEAEELADKINRGRAGRERKALEGKPWEDVRNALEEAAPEGGKARENYLKRVADISRLKDPNSRFKEAQELLRDQSKTKIPDEPAVKLDLTHRAAQLVREFDRDHNTGKSNARKGKAPVNRDKMEPDQRQKSASGDSIGMG